MSTRPSVADKRRAFHQLHESDPFLIPNPWDAGSAKVLTGLGFKALATTSSGFAFTLGRGDGTVTLDEIAAHVTSLSDATDLPVSVDLENGYGSKPEAAAEAIRRVAEAGAVGGSIEDWDPSGHLYDRSAAAERVAAAAEVAHGLRFPFMLTGRAENHLHGHPDLDDTIARLRAYEDAGADVLYAPGLTDPGEIARVVAETGAPVNVLALPGGATVAELIVLGVRRVSTGAGLAWIAYGAALDAARALARGRGIRSGVDRELRARAFGG